MKQHYLVLLLTLSLFPRIASAESGREAPTDPTRRDDAVPYRTLRQSHLAPVGQLSFGQAVLQGETSATATLGAGVLLDRKLSLGAFGTGVAPTRTHLDVAGEPARASIGYGGLWLGYTLAPADPVHLALDGRLGWGSILLVPEPQRLFSDLSEEEVAERDLFAAELVASAEANLSRYLRARLGGGYRSVLPLGSGAEVDVTRSSLSGAVFEVGLSVGRFE